MSVLPVNMSVYYKKKGQKKALDALAQEFQMAMSSVWVLGTEQTHVCAG